VPPSHSKPPGDHVLHELYLGDFVSKDMVARLEKLTSCKVKYVVGRNMSVSTQAAMTENGRRINMGKNVLRAHLIQQGVVLKADTPLPEIACDFSSSAEYVYCWDFTKFSILLSKFDVDISGSELTYDGNKKVSFSDICGPNGFQMVARIDSDSQYALFKRDTGAAYFGPLGMATSFYSELVSRLCVREFRPEKARQDFMDFVDRVVTIQQSRHNILVNHTWPAFWCMNANEILRQVLVTLKSLPLSETPGFIQAFIVTPLENWIESWSLNKDVAFDKINEAQKGRQSIPGVIHKPTVDQLMHQNPLVQPIVHANGGDRQYNYVESVKDIPKKEDCKLIKFDPKKQPAPEMVFQIAPGIPALVSYHLNSPVNLYGGLNGRQMKSNGLMFHELLWQTEFKQYINEFLDLNFPVDLKIASNDLQYGDNPRWTAGQRASLRSGISKNQRQPHTRVPRKCFVKPEVLNKSLDKMPRLITTYSDKYKALYNPLINGMKKYMTDFVLKTHERVGQTFVYTDGMNMDQLGYELYNSVHRCANPAFIEVDYSEFDSSQRAEHFEVLRSIYKHVCKADLHGIIDEYIDDMGGEWTYKIFGPRQNTDVIAKVTATRGSGAGDTSLGNSLLNAFFVFCWQKRMGVQVQQFCLGDDSLIIGSNDDLRKLMTDCTVFSDYGIKAKIKLSTELPQVTYLSRWFVEGTVRRKYVEDDAVETKCADEFVPTYVALRKLGNVIALSTKKVLKDNALTPAYWVKLAQMYKALMNDAFYLYGLSKAYQRLFCAARKEALKRLNGSEKSYEHVLAESVSKDVRYAHELHGKIDEDVLRVAFASRYALSHDDFDDMRGDDYLPKEGLWFQRQPWMSKVSAIDLDNSGIAYVNTFTRDYTQVYVDWFGNENCSDLRLDADYSFSKAMLSDIKLVVDDDIFGSL
jgi:hypothetical protein